MNGRNGQPMKKERTERIVLVVLVDNTVSRLDPRFLGAQKDIIDWSIEKTVHARCTRENDPRGQLPINTSERVW